jgi:hypothetical protein
MPEGGGRVGLSPIPDVYYRSPLQWREVRREGVRLRPAVYAGAVEGRRIRGATLTVIALAVAGALLARLIAHLALGDVAHVQDEQAYLLQARTLAMGRLFTDVAYPRAAFNMWYVDDRWARFGIFPPGWPALLAVGVKLHCVEWVNPALHGVTTWVVAEAARRAAGARAQVVAAAAYGFCPQSILLAASLMSHATVALAGAVLALVGCRLLYGSCTRGTMVLAGAAIGLAELTRPLCAVALAMGFALVVLHALRAGRVRVIGLWPVLLLGFVGTALLLGYNGKLTGSPWRFPQTEYFNGHLPPVDSPRFHYHPGCNDLGFGPGHGCDYGIKNATHDLPNALSNTGDNLFAWLLLVGGGPVVVAALVYALRDRAERGRRVLLLCPAAAAIGLYAVYWYGGTCYGARFYHAGLPGLLLVAALGLAEIPLRQVRSAALAVWLGWNVYALAQSSREISGIYWATDARFAVLEESWDKPDALVLLAFARKPVPTPSMWWTTRVIHAGSSWIDSQRAGGALALDAPQLDGKVVFAKYHPALVGELRRRFPGRQVWLYVEAEHVHDDLLALLPPGVLADPPGGDRARPPDNFDGYELSVFSGSPR